MNPTLNYLSTLLMAGLTSLLDYLAAHVLLCLVPAFIIAGFMSSMIPKEAITRFLGPKASKWISYPASALGGFILAVCSCTILPLFAGIWKRGAGLGPAITFLFVGPAINILAITYTGAAIGFDIAFARLVLSIIFGIVIGLLMARIFRKEEATRFQENAENGLFEAKVKVKPAVWVIFLFLLAVLIVGTLQVGLLTNVYAELTLPFSFPADWMNLLANLNLSLQGVGLILMLLAIALAAWKGFDKIFDGYRIILEPALFVAAQRKIHLFPDWYAIAETNYKGSQEFWGRSKKNVIENMSIWNASHAIIYTKNDEIISDEWLETFKVISEFDWGKFDMVFEDAPPWGKKPTPKWWLLEKKGKASLNA